MPWSKVLLVNNQIAVFELCEVVVEIASGDEGCEFGSKERCGPRFFCGFQTVTRDPAAHLFRVQSKPFGLFFRSQFTRWNIQQQSRDPRVGEMCGDLRAHGARAEDRSFSYAHHASSLVRFLMELTPGEIFDS